MGYLVPFHMQECVPGDSFKIQSKNMLRFVPMVAPVMHQIKVYTTYFFVPSRILWDKFEDFVTGGKLGQAAPAMPRIYPHVPSPGSLSNYLGLPILANIGDSTIGTDISALPFAAYQRIWYDYYRDENLQMTDTEPPPLQQGAMSNSDFHTYYGVLRKRAWSRDYLTSALPFPQKGEAVSIPIVGNVSGTADVYMNDEVGPNRIFNPDGSNPTIQGQVSNMGVLNNILSVNVPGVGSGPAKIDPNGKWSVDGDEFTVSDIATTINDLRTAYALQRWLEKNARGGNRYIETIRMHFGVSPSDSRLQRPEMIGSNIQNVIISEVLQTSQTDEESTPQGNMAGHGISASKDGFFRYSCEEHGYIVGLISVLPNTSYAQGIPRMFSRLDRFQYYWPDFANLGEQAVLNKEVMVSTQGTTEQNKEYNEGTFGYMPRYAEMRYNNSLTTGMFAPGMSLDYWTLTREFSNIPSLLPKLNEKFIVADPSNRIFAVTEDTVPKILGHIYSDIQAWRPLPKYGTPI